LREFGVEGGVVVRGDRASKSAGRGAFRAPGIVSREVACAAIVGHWWLNSTWKVRRGTLGWGLSFGHPQAIEQVRRHVAVGAHVHQPAEQLLGVLLRLHGMAPLGGFDGAAAIPWA
jgi:hypothetical protein